MKNTEILHEAAGYSLLERVDGNESTYSVLSPTGEECCLNAAGIPESTSLYSAALDMFCQLTGLNPDIVRC